jgi:hypothetical protein
MHCRLSYFVAALDRVRAPGAGISMKCTRPLRCMNDGHEDASSFFEVLGPTRMKWASTMASDSSDTMAASRFALLLIYLFAQPVNPFASRSTRWHPPSSSHATRRSTSSGEAISSLAPGQARRASGGSVVTVRLIAA